VLALAENAGALARTFGAAEAGTPFLAFTDDDSWWAPGDLARGVEVMRAHPRLGLLNARILVGPAEELDPVCTELAASPLGTEPDLPGPSLLGFVACAALVRTEAFTAVGGFDPVVRFPGEEERLALDLAAAGWGLAYVDDLTVHHHPSLRREAATARQAGIWRSRVLTALMRYPAAGVAHQLRRAVAAGPVGWRGLVGALPRVPAALRRRRVLPASVMRAVRELRS
jgi:GT2 family glycosyltransferase